MLNINILFSRAVERGSLGRMNKLILKGVDIHYNNDDFLCLACLKGNVQVIEFLINNGLNIHIRNELPIKLTASYGHLDAVKYLIKQGCSIDIAKSCGAANIKQWICTYENVNELNKNLKKKNKSHHDICLK